MPDCDLITFFDTERWRNMSGQIFVSLFISRVFGDEMKVFAADDESSMHLGRNDGASQDSSSDGHFTSEGAFFV